MQQTFICAIVKKDTFKHNEKLKAYAYGFYLEFVLNSNRLLVLKHMNNLKPDLNEKVIDWLRKQSVAFGYKTYDRLAQVI